MQRFIVAVAAIALLLLSGSAGFAQSKVSHRLIAADKGKVAIVNADGQVEWEVENRFVCHDISVLPNGNILMPTGPATIVEMTPDKKIVWRYESRPKEGYAGKVEVHGFQRLSNGLTMIAETGNLRI